MTELDEEARGALQHGLALDGPSAERRARVKQRLAVALGSGTVALGAAAQAAVGSAPAVGASASGIAGASLAAWFGTGVLGGALVAGAIAVVSARTTPHAPAEPSVTAPPPSATVASRTAEKLPRPLASTSEAAPEPSAASSSRAAPSRSATAPVDSDAPGIGEEALLLQRAQRALAASDPAAALALLGEHERRFPTGQLREERQVATVLALCALGRLDSARSLARDFRARSPHSVLIPRLDRSCASGE